jgi:Ricin-type beta-trefoil lectin domain-like
MLKTLPAVIVACGLCASAKAADEAEYVKLVQADTGKVLSVADNSEEAGAKIVVAKDESSEPQQWKLEKDGDYYKIVNRKTGKVLDVEMESKDEGASIIQWDDKAESNDNQRWSWQGNGKSRQLKSKSSDLVLDVDDNGMVIQRKADDNAKQQLWQVVEVK